MTATATKPAAPDVSPGPEQTAASSLTPSDVQVKTIEKPRGTNALGSGIPISGYNEAWRLAEVMASSDLVPKDYKGKPQNVLVAMQHGAEVGLGPMQSVQNIAIVNGRPSVWGDAIMALCRAHPLYEWTTQEWVAEEKAAYTTMKRRGEPQHTVRFGEDDAKTAGLLAKDTYKQHLEAMCRRRSLARCASFVYADALKGLAPADEVMDYIDSHAEPVSASGALRERLTKPRESEPAGKASTEPGGPATVDGESAAADDEDAGEVTEAVVAQWIEQAGSIDALNEAHAAITSVADPDARTRLRKLGGKKAKALAAPATKGASDAN